VLSRSWQYNPCVITQQFYFRICQDRELTIRENHFHYGKRKPFLNLALSFARYNVDFIVKANGESGMLMQRKEHIKLDKLDSDKQNLLWRVLKQDPKIDVWRCNNEYVVQLDSTERVAVTLSHDIERRKRKVGGEWRYEVVAAEKLGSGGMGAVYPIIRTLKEDEKECRMVYTKPDKIDPEKRVIKRPDAKFINDAIIEASLTPNAKPVILRTGSIVMPRHKGPTLKEIIDADITGQKCLSFEQCCELSVGLLQYLVDNITGKDIVHKDIKPQNVMAFFTGNPENPVIVKIIDFGLSAKKTDHVRLNRGVGTPAFMSPEVERGITDVGPPTDVYSTALTISNIFGRRLANNYYISNSGQVVYYPSDPLSATPVAEKIREELEMGKKYYPNDRKTAQALLNAFIQFHESFKKSKHDNALDDALKNDLLIAAAQEGNSELLKQLIANGANVNCIHASKKTPLILAASNGHVECIKILLAAGAKVDALDSEFSALSYAAKYGHIDCVKALLNDQDIDVNLPNRDGFTALHVAIEFGHFDCVQALITAGADVDRANGYGTVPLIIAAEFNRIDCLEELIAKKANVNAPSNNGMTPLWKAAECGHLNCLTRLISAGADTNSSIHHGGFTALFTATQNNRLDCVKELVRAGVDINRTTHQGYTPLWRAAESGFSDIAEELIKAGADFSLGNALPMIPFANVAQDRHPNLFKAVLAFCATKQFINAVETGNPTFVQQLIDQGADVNFLHPSGKSPLIVAAKNHHIDCVKILLTKQIHNINQTDSARRTALHYMSECDDASCILALIAAGANVNLLDIDGLSALYLAVIKGNVDCLNALLSANGIDVNQPDKHGFTPLHLAIQLGHFDCVQALIAAGADVNKANKNNAVPLVIAGEYGRLDCIELLLEKKADVNVAAMDGITSLYCAADKGHFKCLEKLLSVNAGVNPTDSQGFSALYMAVQRNYSECVKALVQAGANVNLANNWGYTPLWKAVELGHVEHVKILVAAGADVNKSYTNGFSAICLAVKNRDMNCVKALLDAGADPSISFNTTQADLAEFMGNNDRARQGNRYGFISYEKVSINAESLAKMMGQTTMIKLLSNPRANNLVSPE